MTGAAIAVTISRIMQLNKKAQEALWECVRDFSTIKTQEDAIETSETILEILDPMDSDPKLLSLDEWKDKEKPDHSWLAYVSQHIRSLREGKKLSQTQLAALSGLPQSHISRLERGVHSPSHKTLKKLAEALEVDVSQLDPSF